MLDQESTTLGKRLGLAVTFYHKPYPLYNAMDLKSWIDENLVDYLIPHWVHIAQDDPAAIVSQFTALTENTDVKLLPYIYPRTPPGEKYAEAAKLMYDAGADGFAFWSAEMRTTRASEWAVVKRLGHKDELNRYSKEAPKFWRSVNLKELDGVFTYVVATGTALGMAKDEMAAKPMVLYESEEFVGLASEEVAIRSVFPHEIDTYDPYEGEVRVWLI